MKGLGVEGSRPLASHNIKDENGNSSRDRTLKLERLARWLRTLLNAKSPPLDTQVAERFEQRDEYAPVNDGKTIAEVEEAIRGMANRTRQWEGRTPDGADQELFLNGDQVLFRQFHNIITHM